MPGKQRVKHDALLVLIQSLLESHGMSSSHAHIVANALVDSSLRAVDTHGIVLLPTYLKELKEGRANPCPQWQWQQAKPGLVGLNADNAPGVLAAWIGAERCIHLAQNNGIGAVAITHSNHFAAAGTFTRFMAENGMIGLAFSNADVLMNTPGGKNPVIGTNPLSIAMQVHEDELFCLDMASSQVAWSKVRQLWNQNQPIPAGWAQDAEGRDCSREGAGEPFTVSPLGGYKGAGLALAIELLCTALLGGRFGFEMSHLYGEPWNAPRECSHLLVAIDLDALGQAAFARERLSALLGHYRQAGATVPGDLEKEQMRLRKQQGIPIPDELLHLIPGDLLVEG